MSAARSPIATAAGPMARWPGTRCCPVAWSREPSAPGRAAGARRPGPPRRSAGLLGWLALAAARCRRPRAGRSHGSPLRCRQRAVRAGQSARCRSAGRRALRTRCRARRCRWSRSATCSAWAWPRRFRPCGCGWEPLAARMPCSRAAGPASGWSRPGALATYWRSAIKTARGYSISISASPSRSPPRWSKSTSESAPRAKCWSRLTARKSPANWPSSAGKASSRWPFACCMASPFTSTNGWSPRRPATPALPRSASRAKWPRWSSWFPGPTRPASTPT